MSVCPICGASHGFHEDRCGALSIPSSWRRTSRAEHVASRTGRIVRVHVLWRDDDLDRQHVTSADVGHKVQVGDRAVEVPLPAWAEL